MRLRVVVALLALPCVVGAAHHPVAESYSFRRDGILGTSLDLTFVTASPDEAVQAERIVLAEIERVRQLISTWDPASEASRLVATGHLAKASPELRGVLSEYARWHERSGGAYTERAGRLSALWRAAEQQGNPPDPARLAEAVAALRLPAITLGAPNGSISAHDAEGLDLSSLGKGYILDLAARAVREALPTLHGGLINIGGDIRSWGEAPPGRPAWIVAVADPTRAADNAPPLAYLRLGEAALSSSGGYARGFTIAGRHYSHILDPRTGNPVDHVLGVTVLAPDNATANALATTLSVLSPSAGLALVASVSGAEALIVTRDGETIRSPGFAAFEVTMPGSVQNAPASIGATIAIDVTPKSWNRHRPYVAVWVTDSAGKHVRTLAVWGDRPKYLRDLSKWWSLASGNAPLVDAVARATRAAGKYTLEWDGLDQEGAGVPPGRYDFWLEVAFENGAHSSGRVSTVCTGGSVTATIPATDAFAGAQIDCTVKK